MSPPPNNRAKDEFDLAILRMVRRGVPQPQVARRLGISRSQIAALLRRVQIDDIAMSGEPAGAVREGYSP